MFLGCGFAYTHEAVRDWEERFAPLIADQLRTKRRGQAGTSWHVDETSVRVQGKWCNLYRAIDQGGNLVDSMLGQKRDMDAAKRFFQQALQTVGQTPERVTTDGHRSYPVRSARSLARTFSIDGTIPSTIDENKTTVASNSVTTPCVVLEAFHRHRVSVGPLMKCVNFSGFARP